MELLYVDNITKEFQYENEYYYFVFNYIIGKRVHLHSNVSFCFHVIKNISKFKENEILDLYEINSFHKNVEEGRDLEEVTKGYELIKKQSPFVKQLKKQKRLNKERFGLVQTFNQVLTSSRDILRESCKDDLEAMDLLPYIDLIDEGVIITSYSTYNKVGKIDDCEIGEKLLQTYINRDKILVLGSILPILAKPILPEDIKRIPPLFSRKVCLVGIPLVYIPCSIGFKKDSLVLLRKQFMSKFDKLLEKIQSFRIEINTLTFNKEIKNKILAFQELLNQDLTMLQDEINTNIYFQNVINCGKEYNNVFLILGILQNEYIGLFHISNYALSKEKHLESNEVIKNKIGKNKSEVFLYYNIEQNR
ncbi:MAG: hypothetical protein WCL51_00085 [Bacteroidota bacterium]